MAWNPSPEIAALRDFAAKFNRPVVVTFSIDANGESFHVTTYGKTKALCKLAGEFGERIAEAVKDGTIAPPEVEPFGDPPGSVTFTRTVNSSTGASNGQIAKSVSEWHEDIGPVLWWRSPIEEPPYVGTPLDADWPGCHIHWTPLPAPPATPLPKEMTDA